MVCAVRFSVVLELKKSALEEVLFRVSTKIFPTLSLDEKRKTAKITKIERNWAKLKRPYIPT